MNLSEEVKIIEKKDVPHGAVMLFGFPDVGLVGVIAASHLISELNLTEVTYVDSRLLPPLIVLHEGLHHSSIRVFGNQNILKVNFKPFTVKHASRHPCTWTRWKSASKREFWRFDCRENTNMKFH